MVDIGYKMEDRENITKIMNISDNIPADFKDNTSRPIDFRIKLVTCRHIRMKSGVLRIFTWSSSGSVDRARY